MRFRHLLVLNRQVVGPDRFGARFTNGLRAGEVPQEPCSSFGATYSTAGRE